MSIIWIIISYFLGSVPFGYIISRFSGKNILEIGWKKTSGSNVFKNVGKKQGILTGLLDLAKGYLAVWGAQKLGLGIEAQVFAGTAAVIGHNWSVFLKFSGGRGIGTFGGAILALSPTAFLIIALPVVAFALFWNSAVGTLFALILMVGLAVHPPERLAFQGFQSAGMFTIFCLLPIFLKRLSPIKEIGKAEKKKNLIANRLVFDNNEALFHLRSKKVVRPLVATLKFPAKAARNGALAAKNGFKYLLGAPEIVVEEIKADDFKKMMIAAAKKIVIHQEEINRINVFPVADKDTGYNLAATLLGVEGTLSHKEYETLRDLAKDMAESAMINARGNVGMISTGYFVEVLDRIKHLDSIDAFHFALAMQRGIKASKESIAEPVEGTILDVIEAAGEKAFEMAKDKKEKNIIRVLEESQKSALLALKNTTEKLKVLKENNVVDAGGLGFAKILEAWIESLKGRKIEAPEPVVQYEQPKAKGELRFRYEIVSLFKKPENFDFEAFKNDLVSLGDSLDMIQLEDKVKFHIHTDQPELITGKLKNIPGAEFKIEDMQEEKIINKEPLGLVVDAIADLPQEFLEKYKIEEVQFSARFSNGEFVISKEEIFPKMRKALESGQPLPTTSAPSFKEFLEAYGRALKKFEKILVITASSKLSGTYSSARIARSTFKKPEKLNIFVFDSFAGEVAEGLVVFRAQELISQGKTTEDVIEDLKRFCPRVTLLATLEDFRYVVHGGRVRIPRVLIKPIFLIQKLGIRPLIKLKNGKIKFCGLGLGKDVAGILSDEVNRTRKGRKIKAAIAHADNLPAAQKLKEELEKTGQVEILFLSFVSPVVGVHTGPGALLVAFYPVDN